MLHRYAVSTILTTVIFFTSVYPAGHSGLIIYENLHDEFALHRACRNGKTAEALIILEDDRRSGFVTKNGCSESLFLLDSFGKTPLAYAIEEGCLDIVEILCKKGATPLYVSKNNVDKYLSAKALAQKSGHQEIIDFFNENSLS